MAAGKSRVWIVVLGWTSSSNVAEQTQPSRRDKKSGWRLAGLASDFVVCDVCCVWKTQDVTKAPLIKSIYSSTGTGCLDPRVCTVEEYRTYGPVSASVYWSQVGVLAKWLNGLSSFLTQRLPSTILDCSKEICIYRENKAILQSGTLSQTLDLEHFDT